MFDCSSTQEAKLLESDNGHKAAAIFKRRSCNPDDIERNYCQEMIGTMTMCIMAVLV